MQLMMAQMKEVMAAVSATDQHRQRIERNMGHNMNTVADCMFTMQEAIEDGRTAPPVGRSYPYSQRSSSMAVTRMTKEGTEVTSEMSFLRYAYT